ncbi:unnamed protein product [Victoria cruziana]
MRLSLLSGPPGPRSQLKFSSISRLADSTASVSSGDRATLAESAVKFHYLVLRGYPPLPAIEQTHARILTLGLSDCSFLATHLVKSYAKAGNLCAAERVFVSVSERSVFLLNAIIRAFSRNGLWKEVVDLFYRMEKENMRPDHYTLPFVIKGIASILDLDGGRKVHDVVRRGGYEGNLHVVTSLIDMYVKFGEIEDARELFDEMCERDVVAWTTMIGAYSQVRNWVEAFSLFRDMRLEGWEPNDVTLLSLISPSSFLNIIHGMVIKWGFDTFLVIETALIDSYAKCGDVKSARELFDRMYWKNSVAWSAIICAYSENGHPCDAMFLFRDMILCSNVMLDHVGALSVLQACSSLGSLLAGQMAHAHILKSGVGSDSILGTCLIDMYAKCGSIQDAFVSFHSISVKNLAAWSAMIGGYGFHGLGKEALDMFTEMQELGFKPDNVALLSILSACSHSGLIDEGTEIFKSMLRTCNDVVHAKHYACMVDLFARSGEIGEICSLLKELPSITDASIWRGIFYACQVNEDCETAEIAARNLYDVVPSDTDYKFMLSNLYASRGKWSKVSKIRSDMRQNGAKKTPGWSSIEINSQVYMFHSADTSHPEWQSIYIMLEMMFAEPDAL